MVSVFDMLIKMKDHYMQYIGIENIRVLRGFLDGYLSCLSDNCNINEFDEFRNFEDYIARIYNEQNSCNAASILIERYNDDGIAIKKFYEHLEEYLKDKQY